MSSGGYTRLMAKFAKITGEFNKSWAEYKNGFGDLRGNHWIGLENMYQLTNRKRMNLFIELRSDDFNITYKNFYIDSEEKFFKINFDESLNDGLANYSINLNGKYFTTFDRDNDNDESRNCAEVYTGGSFFKYFSRFVCLNKLNLNCLGWWFKSCYSLCLTCESSTGQYRLNGCENSDCYKSSENLKMSIIPALL